MTDNPYPVDSSNIVLADVDIMDGLFDRLDAIEAERHNDDDCHSGVDAAFVVGGLE